MISTGVYPGQALLPFMVEAADTADKVYDLSDLVDWFKTLAPQFEDCLAKHGAVLFRGYHVDTTLQFQRALKLVGGNLLDYIDGNSPRTKQSKGIYTSTEYPADQIISLHNELSYCAKWPSYLYFCCVTPPETEGSTILADSRAVLRDLNPALVERFETRGVCYIRNLHGGYGFGPSWQATFETEDRGQVEAFCQQAGSSVSWHGDSLRVVQHGPGVATHPRTGEKVWFNQADQFHPSNHDEEYREALLDMVDGDVTQLPMYCTYGDGQPIDDADLAEVRRCFTRHSVYFPWNKGDFLVVDNMLTAHGRARFTGTRRILVAMA